MTNNLWNILEEKIHSFDPVEQARTNRDFLMKTAKKDKSSYLENGNYGEKERVKVSSLVEQAKNNQKVILNNDNRFNFVNSKSGLYHEKTLEKVMDLLKKESKNPMFGHIMVAAGDLDNFKAYNDHYGSTEADRAIGMYGKLLESIRVENDLNRIRIFQPTRGDEFVVVGLSSKDETDKKLMQKEMFDLFESFYGIKDKFEHASLSEHPDLNKLQINDLQKQIIQERKKEKSTEHPLVKTGLTVGITDSFPINQKSYEELNKKAEKIQKQVKILGRGFAFENQFNSLNKPAREFLEKMSLSTDRRAEKQQKKHLTLSDARKKIYFSPHFSHIRETLPQVRIIYPHDSVRYKLTNFTKNVVRRSSNLFSRK